MKWIATPDSTTMRRFSYAPPILRIQFVSGEIYAYQLVPVEVFHGLRNAESKGGYFNEHIRDHYSFEHE